MRPGMRQLANVRILIWSGECRTRPASQKGRERWCSVRIQVIAIDGDYLTSLRQLQHAVEFGSLPDDQVKPPCLTIPMTDDEFKHLKDLIKGISEGDICPPFEAVQMQFFIYREEAFAYAQGGYGKAPFYETVDTGPPIEGLRFNERSAKRTPLMFPPPSMLADTAVAIGIIDDGIAFAHER